jgi:RNA recognition motif-containing protein
MIHTSQLFHFLLGTFRSIATMTDYSNDNNDNNNDDVDEAPPEYKIHISRVPTTFTEEIVQRILESKLGSSSSVSEVVLIYPRPDDDDDAGAADKHKDTARQSQQPKDEKATHRGFGFVSLASADLQQQALDLKTIRGGLKSTSNKKHTIYLRPYETVEKSKVGRGDDDNKNADQHICYLWQENKCPYGEECKFRHEGPGSFAAAKLSAEDKKKKQKCFTFKKTGTCKRGIDDCPFSHDFTPTITAKQAQEEQPTGTTTTTTKKQQERKEVPKSEKGCISWKTKGKCSKGDACPYRHDELVRDAALKKKEKKQKRKRQEDGNPDPIDDPTAAAVDFGKNEKERQPLSVRVFGLNYETTEQDIRDFFADCGSIVEVTFPLYEDSGRSKGYCGVLFQSPKAVAKATEMDGQELFGRWLRIQAGKMYLRQWEEHEKEGGKHNHEEDPDAKRKKHTAE